MPCISPSLLNKPAFLTGSFLQFLLCSKWRDYFLIKKQKTKPTHTMNKQCHLLLMFYLTIGNKEYKTGLI